MQKYIDSIVQYSAHTNLVGKSTLSDPWLKHIMDSLQLISFIKNKKYSILDMGTGAGLPGVVLSIVGHKNVSLVDSNGKKIKFLKMIKDDLSLNFNIISGRLEKLNNLKFDIITSRALAKLDILFGYSQNFMKKNTLLIFLKGKTVNEEIFEAKKNWKFNFQKHQSITDSRGIILVIERLSKTND
ncbi:16S rRNA (guanine(527)-N(7))-methyltransferase RsmG [Alphaproteobacteria bacterium]|nr:16S rRNA (guanine(527)-N(7))-methyltransferase RsmG [Alphaproteobacteria bacterium]